jgi:hypothetical protein
MNEEDLVLPVNRIPELAEFLNALEVKPAGFGAQLLAEVYGQFFIGSTDLRDQYERYYCVEYPTLRGYLELAHEIYLKPEDLEKKYILKVTPLGGVVDGAYDDNILDAVIECIQKMDETDEGPD